VSLKVAVDMEKWRSIDKESLKGSKKAVFLKPIKINYQISKYLQTV